MTVAEMTPAPEAKRCEAGDGSCGAGQPLYETNGLVHCPHHTAWPASKDGQLAAAIKEAKRKLG